MMFTRGEIFIPTMPTKVATIDHDTGDGENVRKSFHGVRRLSFVARSIGLLAIIAAVVYFAFDQKEISQPPQARTTVPFGDKWVAISLSEPAASKEGATARQPLPDHFGVFAVSSNGDQGAAYDFAVDGAVTDPKQCLERTQAANGVFYTECRKPWRARDVGLKRPA